MRCSNFKLLHIFRKSNLKSQVQFGLVPGGIYCLFKISDKLVVISGFKWRFSRVQGCRWVVNFEMLGSEYHMWVGFVSEFDLGQAIKLTKNLPYSRLTQIFEVYPYLLFEIDRIRRIKMTIRISNDLQKYWIYRFCCLTSVDLRSL